MAVHDKGASKSHGISLGKLWSGPTMEELAKMQNVRPVERLEDLIGGWPVEELEDGFEEELARWREVSAINMYGVIAQGDDDEKADRETYTQP